MAILNVGSHKNIYEGVYDARNREMKVNADGIRQKLQQGKNGNPVQKNDTVDISKAGRDALSNKMSSLFGTGKRTEIKSLSPVSSQSMINDFESAVSLEKGDGTKSDTFDRHVNQMVSAYQQMRDQIEEKYADADKEQQYYVADDGSIQELTKEKELEMLDRAYAKHSEFMAGSTEIWSNLQDFEPQIAYQSKNNIKKDDIKNQAYQAFMSAVNDENLKLLSQEKEGFKLNLGISASVRNELNRIWDYYANLK